MFFFYNFTLKAVTLCPRKSVSHVLFCCRRLAHLYHIVNKMLVWNMLIHGTHTWTFCKAESRQLKIGSKEEYSTSAWINKAQILAYWMILKTNKCWKNHKSETKVLRHILTGSAYPLNAWNHSRRRWEGKKV